MAGSFETFALGRARLLALDVHSMTETKTDLHVRLSGQPDLVDAFEMACTLGPRRCVVRSIEREDAPR